MVIAKRDDQFISNGHKFRSYNGHNFRGCLFQLWFLDSVSFVWFILLSLLNSDNMHLKFTAKNIVSSLVEEQEKAIQRHGRHLARSASIICTSRQAKSLNSLNLNFLNGNHCQRL